MKELKGPHNRHKCTEENPYHGDGYSEHPDAEEIAYRNVYPGGDIVTYKCPWCGTVFEVEMPQ